MTETIRTASMVSALLLMASACQAPETRPAEVAATETRPAEVAAPETVTPTERIDLFNGEDFTGWVRFASGGDPDEVWRAENGVIHCVGQPTGYLRTEAAYENYRLDFEWRWADRGGNSGVLIHVQAPDQVWPHSIEGQVKLGDAGDFWVIGGATFNENVNPVSRRVVKFEEDSEGPVGEWNDYRVVCRDDTIEIYVNGVLQNRATGASLTSGYIGFQSEGSPIEFRNITLSPLDAD